MGLFSLPEDCKIITAIPAQVGAAGTVQSDYISVKNFQRVYIVINYNTAGNAETFCAHAGDGGRWHRLGCADYGVPHLVESGNGDE